MTRQFYNKLYEGQVLVNGADTVTGYNAARALSNTGLSVYGLAESKNSTYSKSSVWKNIFYGNFDIECLKRISVMIKKAENSRGINPVLLLSQDSAVEYVASHQQELLDHYTFHLPEYKVVNRLLDKTIFHSWATNNNILVPQSCVVKNEEGLNFALKDMSFPIIIKPLVRSDKWDREFPNEKLIYISSYKDTDNVPNNLFSLCKRFIVQEWIPGDDEDVFFVLACINKKHEVVSLAGQKLLQWPTLTGSTATCVSIDNEPLVNLGIDILNKSGLVGLGSIEFKRHNENNRYYVTEPTVGRNDYQSYIAPASNKNLSLYYVLNCLDYSYLTNSRQSKAMWIDEIGSLRSIFNSYRKKPSILGSFCIFKYKIRFANFSAYDPITLFRLLSSLIIRKFKRHGAPTQIVKR